MTPELKGCVRRRRQVPRAAAVAAAAVSCVLLQEHPSDAGGQEYMFHQ